MFKNSIGSSHVSIYGERERASCSSTFIQNICSAPMTSVSCKPLYASYTCYSTLFHPSHFVSFSVSLYLYLVRFICQDNFSRYLIFLSKFNFNFGVTYLFVRGEALCWHIQPSIHPSSSICVEINAKRKKRDRKRNRNQKKYIKLKNSHVEITRTISFE